MKWFLNALPRQDPKVRLVCLPFAGGAAAAYRSWGAGLPEDVEVWAVQLPGKGWRFHEEPLSDHGRMADEVATAIRKEVPERVAVFGHSMGAWLGLEVVRRLESTGTRPLALFVSGRQAPAIGHVRPPIGHLEDDAFIAKVVERYGGIPPEILADRSLLMLFLPALRADFVALEGFDPSRLGPVETPIVAMVGDSDPLVSREHLLPWAEATRGCFRFTGLPGGHFYFASDPVPLLDELKLQLRWFLESETPLGPS